MSINQEDVKKQLFLNKLNSKEDLRNWIFVYLGLYLPDGHVDEDSNSSPVEAIWEVYDAYRHNRGNTQPGFIWLSSRESFKTLSESILNVLLMCHFGATVAHLAAIENQANKAVTYITGFINRLKPYLEANGLKLDAQSKRQVKIIDENEQEAYVKVIIATLTGANCVDPHSKVFIRGTGERKAEEVKVGDFVLTRNYLTGEDIYNECRSIGYTTKTARKITLKSGRELILSDDHPIFTNSGWVRSSHLKIGSRVIENNDLLYSESTDREIAIERDLSQVVYGTILGDASIQKIPSGKCRYRVFHAKKNKDYIDSIKNVFESNGIECTIKDYKDGSLLMTKTHPFFNEVHDICIDPNTNKKTVTEKWLSKLTYEGIAYWFMDDGTGNGFSKKIKKDRAFSFATCGFSIEENLLIVNFFKELGLESSLGSVANQTKKRYDIVKLTLASSRKLTGLISPYFIKSLRYKLISTTEEATDIWTVDDGQKMSVPYIKRGCFKWAKKQNLKHERNLVSFIKKQLSGEVVNVEPLGRHKLIDLSMKTSHPTSKSFYANGILVHNSDHTNILSVDEIDVMRFPQAYEEAKLIPGMMNGQYPITIMTSTRKFAFGMMSKEIEDAPKNNNKLLQWNILDVTERCTEDRHKPDEPKTLVFSKKRLPSKLLTQAEFDKLQTFEKQDYSSFEAYAGCLTCPLAPMCKTKLATRPKDDKGFLYKPIDFTIQQFRKISPDMAEAQLLCWRPSSKGLVYPRLDSQNFISISQAYEKVTGEWSPSVSFDDLIEAIKKNEGLFYGGVDWGYTHEATFVIVARLPSGVSLLVDSFGSPGLEVHEIAEAAIPYQKKYGVKKWFCDQAQPANIKTFKKTVGANCPEFTKDVMAGVEALRSQIVTALGVRRFFVVATEENQFISDGLKIQNFQLNAAGNPTTTLAETEYKDRLDALRYIAQNIYGFKGAAPSMATELKVGQTFTGDLTERIQELNNQAFKAKLRQSVANPEEIPDDEEKEEKKGIFFSF